MAQENDVKGARNTLTWKTQPLGGAGSCFGSMSPLKVYSPGQGHTGEVPYPSGTRLFSPFFPDNIWDLDTRVGVLMSRSQWETWVGKAPFCQGKELTWCPLQL